MTELPEMPRPDVEEELSTGPEGEVTKKEIPEAPIDSYNSRCQPYQRIQRLSLYKGRDSLKDTG